MDQGLQPMRTSAFDVLAVLENGSKRFIDDLGSQLLGVEEFERRGPVEGFGDAQAV